MLKGKIEKLKTFDIVFCNMIHEKVLDSNEEFDSTIKRMPLCEKQYRDKRLGCAHGSSNTRFIETLRSISDDFPSKRDLITKTILTFNQLVSKVYLLDHERGFLEYDLHMLKHKPSSTVERGSIQKQITILEEKHTQLLTELGTIKQDIIDTLTE